MARDVDHYFKGEPLEGRPDEVAYRVGKFVRRHRRPLASAALAVGAIAAVVVFAGPPSQRRAHSSPPASAEGQSARRAHRGASPRAASRGREEQDYAPSKDLRVVSLVDRGLTQARGLAADPTAQSDFYATLGSIYERLGNLTQADWLLRAALDERRTLYGRAHSLVAESEIDLALLLGAEDKLDEAESRAHAAVATAESLRPANPAEVAASKAALGVVLEGAGRYKESSRRCWPRPVPHPPQRTDRRARNSPRAPAETWPTSSSTWPTYDARPGPRPAGAGYRKLNGNHHPTCSSDLFNLAAIKQQRGEYADAERYCREGLEITRAWFDPKHPQVAADLTMLERTSSPRGKLPTRARTFPRRSAFWIQEHVPPHGWTKHTTAVKSVLNRLTARHHRPRDQALRRGHARVLAHGRHLPQGVPQGALPAGARARQPGQRVSALVTSACARMSRFNDALAVYAKTLPSDHDNVAISRVKLGRALLGERRYADAEAESRAGYEILMKKAVARSIEWLQWRCGPSVAGCQGLASRRTRRFEQELSVNEK